MLVARHTGSPCFCLCSGVVAKGIRGIFPVNYDECLLDPQRGCTTFIQVAKATPMAWRRKSMAWTKPTLKEIACGMEINMYAPAEDEPVLF